jgi:hypothetical protein
LISGDLYPEMAPHTGRTSQLFLAILEMPKLFRPDSLIEVEAVAVVKFDPTREPARPEPADISNFQLALAQVKVSSHDSDSPLNEQSLK